MTVENEPALELFIPGRLCLFGEHSDWAGAYRKHNSSIRPGRTIVVGTEQGLYARVRRLSEPRLALRSTRGNGSTEAQELPMEAKRLAEEAEAGGFWAYAAGVAYKFLIDFGVGGLEVDNYNTTLPLKKGLSSSAAFCVLVARAFNRVYGLQLTTRGEMQYAYEGERLTPSRCGKMDQAVAFGQVPVLMTYDGDLLHVEPAQLGGAPLHLVLVDLLAGKDTVAILSGLQEAFPHPVGPEQEAAVELLGPINERITGQAIKAMAAGDAQRLGELMCEAQREFDARAAPLCPSALASPVLHKVLAHPPIQGLVYGGKGVGSQGDGSAQLLAKDAANQAEVCAILERDLGVHCIPLTVPPTIAANPSSVPSSAAILASAPPEKGTAAAAGLAAAFASEESTSLEEPSSEPLPQRQQQRRRGGTPRKAAAIATAGAAAVATASVPAEAPAATVNGPTPVVSNGSSASVAPPSLATAQNGPSAAAQNDSAVPGEGAKGGHALGPLSSTRARDSATSLKENGKEEGKTGASSGASSGASKAPTAAKQEEAKSEAQAVGAGSQGTSGGASSGGERPAAKHVAVGGREGGAPQAARAQPVQARGQVGDGHKADPARGQQALSAVQKALRGLKP